MQSKREMYILNILREKGIVEATDIADSLNVSITTVRRDLTNLQSKGLLLKTRGGAILQASQQPEDDTPQVRKFPTTYEIKSKRMIVEKKKIGKAARGFIECDSTIILETGTTVIELARNIKDIGPLTVITNGINVVLELQYCPNHTVILLGGINDTKTASMIGPLTEKALNGLRADIAFIGCDGITVEDGIMNNNLLTASVKKMMAQVSSKTILLIDSSKIGTKAAIPIIPVQMISAIITDDGISSDMAEQFKAKGVEVIIV